MATASSLGICGAFFPNVPCQKGLYLEVRGQGVLHYLSLSKRSDATFRLIGNQDFPTKLYLSKVD